jgi:alkaline phosphatase D
MNTVIARSIKAGLAIGMASLLLFVALSSTIGAESIQMGTQSCTEKAQRATEKNSVRLCVSSAISVFLKSSAFVGVTRSGSEAQLALVGAAETLPNGVAAGDTRQTSTMLWTRGTTVGDVLFEYSTDPAFSADVFTATATITDLLQPVKVEITGLCPATPYVYRVTDATGASARGRLRTAATVDAHTGLRFGAAGDWGGQLAPYPSIANADERNLDFFVEHGDTIVAGHPAPAAATLEEFRLKHNEIYSTHLGLNTWADLRALTSILATIDDTDVRDGFAGGADASTDSRFVETSGFINETQLYGNALQAFQEYNPLRDEFYGATGDPRTANKRRLYRFRTYGRDAAVFILDMRSFRDEQLPLTDPTDPAQVLAFLTDSLNDTSRTLLGAQQLADLKADLRQAQADGITWKFILGPGAIQNLGLFHAEDRYEGYAAERTDLLRFIDQSGIDNVVFIAAGLHGTVVNNLTYQETPLGPQISTGAFEVIVGPVAAYPPFGPATIGLAENYGLITPEERAAYDASSREGKDEFVRQFVDERLLAPLGYDPIGLGGSEVEAVMLQGGYVAAHTYGWTEFEIGPSTQTLTVTTYGIDPYTEAELIADPGEIIARTPAIVSQFIVTPKKVERAYLPLVVQSGTP